MPSIEWNKRHWTASLALHSDDGSRDFEYGDQWGTVESYPPLEVVRDAWLLPFVGPQQNILEIGTGGGRWTQFLINAKKLYSVDVNPVMLEYAAKRFGAVDSLSLIHTDGESIPGVPPASIDFVFSFGTFVHIDVPQIRTYLQAFRPLLRPGAQLVLHYADKTKPTAARNIHFAHTDALLMEALVCGEGYRVVRHETNLIHHSNIIHFQAVDTPPTSPWPLSTRAKTRLLAWPDYRSAEDIILLFQIYGAVLADQPDTCLCLRRDPRCDLPSEDVERLLGEAFDLTLKGKSLDVLILDDEIPEADWPRLGAAVSATLDLPSARFGRRAAMLSAVGVPRVRTPDELKRVLPQ